MFLLDYLHGTLVYWGLMRKKCKLLFLGLDNAGKSTLLIRLQYDTLRAVPPTVHPISQELLIGNSRCATFDLGGHQQARRLWKDYFPDASGVVFIVDAADRQRFAEARAELGALLSMDGLADVPLVVLGNKIDHPDAVSEDQLRLQLGIGWGMETCPRPVHVFMCSIIMRSGYREALEWLIDLI
ncbi:SAR/ARF type small GTPase [Lasiosphaeria hispida]|uniref:Small COPII coat GTPase SAR1 n=1 Tax=Lasiosphaeria hispida TaxID=260671 RepID=A0AAJ0HRX3_9PEZI|nr:SAR/ARF type small GTPase [Lasiosphaeria hispida]